MRLRNLELTAIGPYLETQQVDFARLSASGIFLFEGPTGAGKSTLLDAITFALYGTTAGSGAKGRLASQYAQPGSRPEVRLEFAVNGKTFEITRSPEHERPKKRGEGTTTERASVLLKELRGGQWEVRSSAHDEVGGIIQQELGLNADQFSQVVLLPQGEFDTFLQADADERQKVLTKLFAAHRYEKITDWLDGRAKEARKERHDAENRVREARSAAAEAAHLPEDVVAQWREAPEGQLRELLQRQRDELREAEEAAALRAEELGGARDAAELAQQAAQSLSDRAGRAAQLRDKARALAEQKPAHESREAELAAARRAEPVAALLERLATAQAAEQAAADAVAASSVAGEAATAEEARSLAERRALAAAALDHVVPVEEGLPGLRRQAEEAAAAAKEAAQQVESLLQQRSQLPGLIQGLRQSQQEAAAGAAVRGEAHLQVESWQDRADSARQAEDLAGQAVAADSLRRQAVDDHQAAVDRQQALVLQRINGMAAELAAGLQPDQPCPVCGSAEHPSPAASDAAVDPADLQAADDEVARLATAREAAEKKAGKLDSDLAVARAQAAGHSVTAAEEALAGARERLAQAVQAAETADRLGRELADAEAQQTDLGERLLAAQESSSDLRAAADRAGTEVAEAQAEVERQLQGHPTVARRRDALRAQAEQFKQLAAARSDWERRRDTVEEETAAAEAKASENFDDLQAARRAVRTPEQRAQLERQIEEHRSEADGVAAGLRAPDLAGITEEQIDTAGERLAAANEALNEASSARDRALDERKAASTRRDRFSSAAKKLEDQLRAQQEVQDQTQPVLDMDSYARGMSGARRMTLTTFYLRYWFERVLAAANARLAKMADGKYTLLRTDGGASARDRGGLTLEVLDNHTGKPRAPGTLSGGERFYTSLSLALGLADVVSAEAGGASLDTLFIDEGFGSLDPERLDEVLKVLNDLRSDQRVVGIVSHVAELKDQISDRIEVRRESSTGPSTLHVRA